MGSTQRRCVYEEGGGGGEGRPGRSSCQSVRCSSLHYERSRLAQLNKERTQRRRRRRRREEENRDSASRGVGERGLCCCRLRTLCLCCCRRNSLLKRLIRRLCACLVCVFSSYTPRMKFFSLWLSCTETLLSTWIFELECTRWLAELCYLHPAAASRRILDLFPEKCDWLLPNRSIIQRLHSI